MAAIDVRDLTKRYGEIVGVESLTFSVEHGEIFGFLGPNGAGKTTAIRTFMGLLAPTEGTATVLGADVREESELVDVKRRVGYLPANLSFDGERTGRRVLDYHEAVKGGSRREALLEVFTPPLDQPIREYSSGNRQMLGIVQAFMHDPELVIMDEPTSGLDPLKKERFNEFLRSERDRGTTVFFSSHVLSEVRRVCDRVGILRGGRLVALENMESLLERGGKRVRVQLVDLPESLDHPAVVDAEVVGEELRFTYTGDYNELLRLLSNYDVLDIDISEPPLEDVFMHFYGEADPTTPETTADDAVTDTSTTADSTSDDATSDDATTDDSMEATDG